MADPLDHDGDGKKGGAKKATVIVELKRAHWIGEQRINPGELIEVDIDIALKLTSNGVATRTDPLKAE